jgi:hypothetical protein
LKGIVILPKRMVVKKKTVKTFTIFIPKASQLDMYIFHTVHM